MTNILLISHSEALAKATYDFITNMLPENENANISYLGGNDDGSFGNSFNKITTAFTKAKETKNRTLAFCDMGSAIMIAQMVIETNGFTDKEITLVNGPFVEGAFVAYSAIGEDNFEDVLKMSTEKVQKVS